MTTGPQVQLCNDDSEIAETSRAYGLPVVSADGYTHAPECHSCHGTANRDTCPRSVWLREYSERGIAAMNARLDAEAGR